MTKPVEMTIREFLEKVSTDELIVKNKPELAKFAEYRLKVMDKQKAKKTSQNSKTSENLELFNELIANILKEIDEPLTVKTIRENLEKQGENFSSSKITAILKVAEKTNRVEQVQPEKKSHPMRYKLIEEEEEQEQEEK